MVWRIAVPDWITESFSLVSQLLALVFAVGTVSKLMSPSKRRALTQHLDFTEIAGASVYLRKLGIKTFCW